MFYGSEGFGAEAGRIAQASRSDLERKPRKYRQPYRSSEGELTTGRGFDHLHNPAFVVVRIDEQAYRQQRRHDQNNQTTECDSNPFQGLHFDHPHRKPDAHCRTRLRCVARIERLLG